MLSTAYKEHALKKNWVIFALLTWQQVAWRQSTSGSVFYVQNQWNVERICAFVYEDWTILGVVRNSLEDIRLKQADLWHSNDLFFYLDNAPSSHFFGQKLNDAASSSTQLTWLGHLWFAFVPSVEKDSTVKRFADISEVKLKLKDALEGIQKDEHKRCF